MERFEQAFQPFRCDEQGFWRREFDRIRNAFKGALRALHGFFQLTFSALGVGHPNARVGRDKVEQRLDGFVEALVADVGHHHRPGHFVDAELRDGIKLPDGVHLIAKELDAVGMVKRVGKHIDNASAHCVLPGFVHKIDFAEPVLDEHLVEEVYGVLLAQGQGKGLFGKLALTDDLFGNGFPEGDYGEPLAVAIDLVENLGAHRDVGVFRDLFLVWNPRRTWEKQHVVGVANQLLKVIEEVSGRFLVVKDKKVAWCIAQGRIVGHLPAGAQYRSREQGRRGSHDSFEFGLGTVVFPADVEQVSASVRSVKIQEVVNAHFASYQGANLARLFGVEPT